MKVVFLDFDGVLNSHASFLLNRRLEERAGGDTGFPIADHLCYICASNFQKLIEEVPELKVVISSTWRKLHSLEWLQETLSKYCIDSSRVIDITPDLHDRTFVRGHEIDAWLKNHPEVSNFIILDDDSDMSPHMHHLIQTDREVGLTLKDVELAKLKLLVSYRRNDAT